MNVRLDPGGTLNDVVVEKVSFQHVCTQRNPYPFVESHVEDPVLSRVAVTAIHDALAVTVVGVCESSVASSTNTGPGVGVAVGEAGVGVALPPEPPVVGVAVGDAPPLPPELPLLVGTGVG